MQAEHEQKDVSLDEALKQLIEYVRLESVLKCAVPFDGGGTLVHPRTGLLHVKFAEDTPAVHPLARFLWNQCVNYALPRRRRIALKKAISEANEADLSALPDIVGTVRNIFIEYNREYPSRASEIGEVLAYCIAVHQLDAPQVAAKMALKTSANMPIHGLDGIHAKFEHGALTIFFLESKIASTANSGAAAYAESVSKFINDQQQYLREYQIVGDLGNLDSLEGSARELALQYFDVLGSPELPRRERYVGVICYSENKHFSKKLATDDGAVDIHENHFTDNYVTELEHHRSCISTHLEKHGANPNKCLAFFVAVPDVDELRRSFYAAMGLKEEQLGE